MVDAGAETCMEQSWKVRKRLGEKGRVEWNPAVALSVGSKEVKRSDFDKTQLSFRER